VIEQPFHKIILRSLYELKSGSCVYGGTEIAQTSSKCVLLEIFKVAYAACCFTDLINSKKYAGFHAHVKHEILSEFKVWKS